MARCISSRPRGGQSCAAGAGRLSPCAWRSCSEDGCPLPTATSRQHADVGGRAARAAAVPGLRGARRAPAARHREQPRALLLRPGLRRSAAHGRGDRGARGRRVPRRPARRDRRDVHRLLPELPRRSGGARLPGDCRTAARDDRRRSPGRRRHRHGPAAAPRPRGRLRRPRRRDLARCGAEGARGVRGRGARRRLPRGRRRRGPRGDHHGRRGRAHAATHAGS